MEIISRTVEAHVVRRNGNRIEFLALKRSKEGMYPNIWQMVTGSIRENEKAYQTAAREIFEETKLIPEKFWVLPNINSFYSLEDDSVIVIPVFVAEVHQNSEVSISDEHSEFQWVTKEKMIDLLAWPGQKKSVEILFEYFAKEKNIINLIEIKI